MLLGLVAGCFPDLPDEQQSGVFPCRTDDDCIDGFFCQNDVCVDSATPARDAGADARDGGATTRDGGAITRDGGATTRDGGAVTRDGGMCADTWCGTDCVDLLTTSEHCGMCFDDCGGGACVDGACQAVTVLEQNGTTLDAIVASTFNDALYVANRRSGGSILALQMPGAVRSVVASNQEYPTGLATNDDYVFWSTFEGGSPTSARGYVRYAEATEPRTVRDASLDGQQLTPEDVAVEGDTVYWASDSPLHIRGHVAGSMPRQDLDLLPQMGSSFVDHVLADVDGVYWVDSIGAVFFVDGALSSGSIVQVLDDTAVSTIVAVAQDDFDLFVAESATGPVRTIHRVAKDGAGLSTVLTVPNSDQPTHEVGAMALHTDALIYATNAESGGDGAVFVFSLGPTPPPPQKLADALNDAKITGLTVLNGIAYWTEREPTLSRVRGIRIP